MDQSATQHCQTDQPILVGLFKALVYAMETPSYLPAQISALVKEFKDGKQIVL